MGVLEAGLLEVGVTVTVEVTSPVLPSLVPGGSLMTVENHQRHSVSVQQGHVPILPFTRK